MSFNFARKQCKLGAPKLVLFVSLAAVSAPFANSQDRGLSSRAGTSSTAPPQSRANWSAVALYATNNSQLSEGGRMRLEELAKSIKGANLEIVIAIGHTDATEIGAQALSEARAEGVRSHLNKLGIERQRIYVEGKGAESPVSENSTSEGRARNRRVEIEAIGTKISQ